MSDFLAELYYFRRRHGKSFWLLCFIAFLLVPLVMLGAVPKLRQGIKERVMLWHYNAGTSAFDTKVRFWGQVVDQNGQPVAGATIRATVTTLRMVKVENGYREYEILAAQSAPDGTFMFDGAEGFSLTIRELSKNGYVLPSAYQAGMRWEGARYFFRYKSIGNVQSVFHPNPSQPEVFHLWKLNKPEPLIMRGNWAGPYGEEFRIGDAPTMLGNISIMVTQEGTDRLPEWVVTVSALEADGGVIKAESTDIFMFQAPESGYTKSISFRYGPDGTDAIKGEDGAPVRFYVRSKGGRWYSARECAFFSPNENDKVRTKMLLWTNPNGSRNLEHDAAHPLDEPRLSQ